MKQGGSTFELDVMLEMCAEDAVFDVSLVFTDTEPMRGRAAIREYWERFRETWDDMRIEPIEGFDLGHGRIVLDQRIWATGTRSGIEIDQRFGILYAMRPDDGLVAHAQLFPDVPAAIAAGE